MNWLIKMGVGMLQRHKLYRYLIFTQIFLWGLIGVCWADIYMYVDERGVMHFTNAPTSSKYKLYIGSGTKSFGFDSYTTSKYDSLITQASETHGVSFPLVKAVIKVESNFNPRAVSHKGAQGLMQIMPETAKLLNISDPFDPWENIMGGTRYLRSLLDKFSGDLQLALAGYNAGPARVEQHNGIPPIQETQEYVRNVIKYYRILSRDMRRSAN